MKYLIRAIKYFFYFSFLTTAIILVLILIGAVEGDINTIFEDGYNTLWKIAIFFALVAAVYPKFGFVCRKIDTTGDWNEIRDSAKAYFSEKPFRLESESADSMTFIRKDTMGRITKMFEDRITVSRTEEGYTMEGLRKDVMIYAAGLEHRLPPYNQEQV